MTDQSANAGKTCNSSPAVTSCTSLRHYFSYMTVRWVVSDSIVLMSHRREQTFGPRGTMNTSMTTIHHTSCPLDHALTIIDQKVASLRIQYKLAKAGGPKTGPMPKTGMYFTTVTTNRPWVAELRILRIQSLKNLVLMASATGCVTPSRVISDCVAGPMSHMKLAILPLALVTIAVFESHRPRAVK